MGIPGYTGKIAMQSERRLSQASDLELKTEGFLGGVGVSISATALINAISGRTKQLKNQVKLEEIEALLQSVKGRLANDFFASNPLEEHLRMEFLYFCADDENFIETCKNETDIQILEFLKMKYEQYLQNRSDTED
ncbi:MAG: hypothetical protein ACM31G_09055 [Flavobacteriales bacterium]